MSKKKKKFNKNEILNQINRQESAVITPNISDRKVDQNLHTNSDNKKSEPSINAADAKITKQDLKKTGLIMLCLIILLLVIYYLSLKTDLINQLSNQLAIWLHIK